MIKCNVKIVGTISKAAQVRQNKDGKPFTSFGVGVVIPNPNGIKARANESHESSLSDGRVQPSLGGASKTVEVGVIKDGAESPYAYVVGNRIELTGELTFRKMADTLYFNLNAEKIHLGSASAEDSIKGELHMKGTVGKNIEVKTTKTGKTMLIFSAYSGAKTDSGFTFTWVRFVQFDAARPDWLQPKSTIEAKGELEISLFNDRINLGCKLAELKQWDKPVFTPRDMPFKPQDSEEELVF